MAGTTNIEWTDATWNPVTGCTEVTEGCDNCYARDLAEAKRGTPAFPNGFDVTLRPHKMGDPLRWKQPRRVFVNSMSDVFHEQITDDYIAQMFAVMALADRHHFQVLTKRPGRMARLLAPGSGFASKVTEHALELGHGGLYEPTWPLPNVWLGTTVENQRVASARIGALVKTPAAVRFLSCEPLIGPLDLTSFLSGGAIRWVIDGGESGPRRRPADPDWFRAVRDACLNAGVAYMHKQGNHRYSGRDRELDGRTWDQYPAELEGRDREAVHGSAHGRGVTEEVIG